MRQIRKLTKGLWFAGTGAVVTAFLIASVQCNRQVYEMSHEDLVSALHKGDHSRKRRIISELAARHDKRAAKPLIAALQDLNPSIRSDAILALGKIGDRRAVAPLIGFLKNPELGGRMAAIHALGVLGDKQAVEPLIATLKEEPMAMRIEVIWVLGNLCDKRAVTNERSGRLSRCFGTSLWTCERARQRRSG